jgi:hypothetical protein
VISHVAAWIGVSEEAGRPLLDTLADALRPRRLLLVLDNCEHLIRVFPMPPGPHRVRARACRSIRRSSAISRSRPMKRFGSSGR